MHELDREFVEYVVKALVSNPDEVKVERSVDDRGVLLELTVAPEDMGKVIGRAGATAKSIRTLLRALGAQNDERVNLKIIEPDGTEPAEARAAQPEEGEESSELAERTRAELADVDDLEV